MNSGHNSEHGGIATARSTDQGDSRTRGIGATAGEAVSKLGEAGQQVGRQAKEAATSLASEANEKFKGMMNDQVGAGADLVGHVAVSVRQAADSLDQNIPQLAGLVRDAADRIENFSDDIRDKSVDELLSGRVGLRPPAAGRCLRHRCGRRISHVPAAERHPRLRLLVERRFRAASFRRRSLAGRLAAGRTMGLRRRERRQPRLRQPPAHSGTVPWRMSAYAMRR